MTDIVERLRAEGAMTGHYHVPAIQREAAAEIEWLREESERLRAEVVLLEATGAECADEIERLRAEVAGEKDSCDAAWAANNRLNDERARLRLALRIIAGYEQCIDNLMSNGDVARAALGENSHD